jgi:hypothetical protein
MNGDLTSLQKYLGCLIFISVSGWLLCKNLVQRWWVSQCAVTNSGGGLLKEPQALQSVESLFLTEPIMGEYSIIHPSIIHAIHPSN